MTSNSMSNPEESRVIGYIKESHSLEPKNHEWIEAGEMHYRSVCNRWTVLRKNIVAAAELSCLWCLSRGKATEDRP